MRCSASSRRWSTRATGSRPTSACSPASPTMMVAAAPRIDAVLPAFLEFARGTVLVAHNAPFDLGFLRAACEAAGIAWPAFAVGRHRRPGPPGAHPRRGAQLQAGHARAVLLAPPPSRPTAPWTTPGPPSTCCTGCSSGSARSACSRWRSCTGLTRAGRPATQRRKRHLAEHVPAGPGVYVFRGAARRAAVRRHRPATCAAGSAATSPPASSAAGWPRWSRWPSASTPIAVRARPGGRGPRAAADRRAQAPLQPPLPVPRAGPVGAADRRAVPPAVRRPAGPPGRRRVPRPVPRPAGRRRARSPPSTRRCRCASAPRGCP